MQVDTKPEPNYKPNLFVFYDFETRQQTLLPGSNTSYIHEPNLLVLNIYCDLCEDDFDSRENCIHCGIREFVFDKSPVQQFLEYLSQPFANTNKVICIAHNSSFFDLHFLVKEMVETLDWLPKIISKGGRLTCVKVWQKIIFLDSLSYCPMSLSKMGAAFDIPTTKVFFCHLFNKHENATYVGPMPDLKYYDVDHMLPDERLKCIAWYNKQVASNYLYYQITHA